MEVDEFLRSQLVRAGYSRVELNKSPLGMRIVIHAARPGSVIGRRGQSIRDLTNILQEKFGIENPQISVAAIESPDSDPHVVAGQIASALQRGIHFRRAAYAAVQRVMEAGVLGVEVSIRGKLTTDRARYEKYRAGYLPRVGDPVLKQRRTATVHTQLKQGLFGVKVLILPRGASFPDKPALTESRMEPSVQEPANVKEEPKENGDTEEA